MPCPRRAYNITCNITHKNTKVISKTYHVLTLSIPHMSFCHSVRVAQLPFYYGHNLANEANIVILKIETKKRRTKKVRPVKFS